MVRMSSYSDAICWCTLPAATTTGSRTGARCAARRAANCPVCFAMTGLATRRYVAGLFLERGLERRRCRARPPRCAAATSNVGIRCCWPRISGKLFAVLAITFGAINTIGAVVSTSAAGI
ncbi:hypothetical protein U1Q18_052240 [Sarracenia purpurea var. burkii]